MNKIKYENKCFYCKNFLRHHVITDTGVYFTKTGSGDCKLDNRCVNENDPSCENFVPIDGADLDSLIWKLRFAAKDIGLIVWHLKELLRLKCNDIKYNNRD